MDRWARLRRAVVWTLVAGGLLVQGLLLVRFAADATVAFLRDPDAYAGRWWHQVAEPTHAFVGYALVVVAAALLARAWTRVVRRPRSVRVRREPGEADGGGEGAVAIEMPAFLRPKTRRTRPGAGALAAWTAVGVALVVAGAVLGVFESLQLHAVASRFAGDASVLSRNSTVWILRLMLYFAPALLAVGGAVVASAWAAYWPLPPAREVVVGQKQKARDAGPARPEWQTVD